MAGDIMEMLSPYRRLKELLTENDRDLEEQVDACGPPHKPSFTAKIYVKNASWMEGNGQGLTKKEARHRAALEILRLIKDSSRAKELTLQGTEWLDTYDFGEYERSISSKQEQEKSRNYIGLLNEFVSRRDNMMNAVYEDVGETGIIPQKIFVVKCTMPHVLDKEGIPVVTIGKGRRKKLAQTESALQMYNLLTRLGYDVEATKEQLTPPIVVQSPSSLTDDNSSPSELSSNSGQMEKHNTNNNVQLSPINGCPQEQLFNIAQKNGWKVEYLDVDLNNPKEKSPNKEACIASISGSSPEENFAAEGVGATHSDARRAAAANLIHRLNY